MLQRNCHVVGQAGNSLLMRPLLLIITLTLVIACKKEGKTPALEGLWIEKSQRLDTLDFDNPPEFSMDNNPSVLFKARPYMDPAVSTVYPQIYSSIYSYYFEQGAIRMRSFLSSSYIYGKYDFSFKPDHKSFTIKKFYGRESLPDMLEFERLK